MQPVRAPTPIIEICPPHKNPPLESPKMLKNFGHPQTCVYPDVCLGIAHVSGNAPLSG